MVRAPSAERTPTPGPVGRRGPKPQIAYDGKTYSMRSYTTPIPDLAAMSRLQALAWLVTHTVPQGYSRPGDRLPPVTLIARG